LHRVEEITIENGWLLAGKHFTPENDLADVESVTSSRRRMRYPSLRRNKLSRAMIRNAIRGANVRMSFRKSSNGLGWTRSLLRWLA